MTDEIDKTRIANAIENAEMRTSGEIFCVTAQQSGDYRLYPAVWATVPALLLPLPSIYLTDWSLEAVYLLQLVAYMVTVVVLNLPPLRTRIVPRRVRQSQVHAEAMRQFFAHGLDTTENRTGVLIFASTAEHCAEIVADASINELVDQAVWDDAMDALISGIKGGRPTDGFVAAIEKCGAVLAEHFPPGKMNRNELPNRLVEI